MFALFAEVNISGDKSRSGLKQYSHFYIGEFMKIKMMSLLIAFLSSVAVQAYTNEEVTKMVEEAKKNLVVDEVKHYCVKGTMTCRSMYTLKDKTTGEKSSVRYDTFYSADRQVGSTCYFIPDPNFPGTNRFLQVGDTDFDGKLNITYNNPSETGAYIKIDKSNNSILFGSLKMPQLGTTKYALAEMQQYEDEVILLGTMYDSADSSVKTDIMVEYFRVNP